MVTDLTAIAPHMVDDEGVATEEVAAELRFGALVPYGPERETRIRLHQNLFSAPINPSLAGELEHVQRTLRKVVGIE